MRRTNVVKERVLAVFDIIMKIRYRKIIEKVVQ